MKWDYKKETFLQMRAPKNGDPRTTGSRPLAYAMKRKSTTATGFTNYVLV
jgi:hypothetical protein